MRHAVGIFAAALLAGCAHTTGAISSGQNTYTVTASASPGAGGVPKAKAMAYADAAKQCAPSGSQVATIAEKLSPPTWTEGMAIATVDFRCDPK